MNDAAAADVLLLRAYERGGFASWTEAERAAASRSALQAVGSDARAEDFLAARAQFALPRLAKLDPLLPRWLARPRWRAGWWALALLLGLVAGLIADRIGSAQRINLLAPPVWTLIAWNLGVYLWLLVGLVRAPAGVLRQRLLQWLSQRRWRRLQPEAGASAGHSAGIWQAFSADWAACSLPLHGARLATALHLGAAALGLGLLAGLYLRGLVLDYRVGWESTFLDAAAVQSALSTLLAPAVALTGIAVPDVAGMQALRLPQAAHSGASAAPWIHLYAVQLLLLVVLPRLLLALWAGWRARRLRRDLPLPLDDAYFQRLLQRQRGGSALLRVWPHAHTPDMQAQAGLRALVQRALGDGATLQLAPTVAYGTEDEATDPTAGALRVVLCDLGATPEPESQGRLQRALGAPLLLLDEAAFVQRFGAASPRRAERHAAWSALAASLGAGVAFADLQRGNTAEAEAALLAAGASASP
jgi:cytochrome c biogenesis protein CcdA